MRVASGSNSHGERSRRASAGKRAASALPSASRSSAGASRAISASSASRESSSVTLRAPAATSRAATPKRPAPSLTATRQAVSEAASKVSSVSVPGVTTRTTSRFTGPLPPTSPVCSQIATGTPRRTSRERWLSSAWYGIPAIGIGLPPLLPRAVRVMSSSSAARLASS